MFQGQDIWMFENLHFETKLQAITSASDWLTAERTCISEGGTLAKIESAAENAAVLTLMGDTRDGETV